MPSLSRNGGDKSLGSDPFPVDGGPNKPGTLSADESDAWDWLMSRIPSNCLRKVDALQLEILCQCKVGANQLNRVLQLDPLDHKTRAKYIALVAHIRGLSAQFGLSPVDRQRMKLAPETQDDLEDFLGE